jgi:Ion channel
MDAKTEELLKKLTEGKWLDLDAAGKLAAEAERLKESAPGDALRVYRALALAFDAQRMGSDVEKLHYFQQASDLGLQLGDLQWRFDNGAAKLFRRAGKEAVAGIYFERAAKAVRKERATEGADPNLWQFEGALIREAQVSYQAAGVGHDASRCFIEARKLLRDHATNRWTRARAWFSWGFWLWGESPGLVALWAFVVIGLFALGYAWAGVSTPTGVGHHFGQALYLSVLTFTTVGYGDLTPATGFGKALAGAEALLGIFFTGLFLVTFVKKFTR